MPAPSVIKKKTHRTLVSNGALKSFLASTKNETVLLGDVARHLQLRVNDRDKGVIHPSEMANKDWCERDTYLRITGHVKSTPKPSLTNELIFAEGHAIHEKWQDWLSEMGVLFGKWECRICHAIMVRLSSELPTRGCCLTSGDHLWEYKEVPLRIDSANISGHADGLVHLNKGWYLLEIKSIGPGTLRMLNLLPDDDEFDGSETKFNRITHILGSHFRQVQIYMAMTKICYPSIPVDKSLIIYEQKADQQAREFVIEHDPAVSDALIGRAQILMDALNSGMDVVCPFDPMGCPKCKGYK